MNAIHYSAAGPAAEVLQLGEIDTPEPGPHEVRVRVHASGLNPTDTKARARGLGLDQHGWMVPHNDGAGVVESVGGCVTAVKPGERVWLHGATGSRRYGTCAEYTVLPATRVVPLPDGVGFAAGACMGIPAMTAHFGVFGEGPVRAKTILVHGGAGGVGYYAIQWGVWGRARVIATVSTPEKAELARAAGAHEVINYRQEDVAARVAELTDGAGVARIVDVAFGANVEVNLATIADGGSIASYGSDAIPEPTVPFYRFLFKHVKVHPFLVFKLSDGDRAAAIADITAALASGFLAHHIAHRFPLAETVRAHELLESGGLAGGKIVIEP